MSEFIQFDPAKHVVSFAGLRVDGFAKGTSIKCSLNSPTFSLKAGTQGDVVRQRSYDATGRIEITLLGGASVNAQLALRHKLDKATGLGYGPFELIDLNGTTVVMASRAWIVQAPDYEFGDESPDVTWVIEAADLVIEHGSAVVL